MAMYAVPAGLLDPSSLKGKRGIAVRRYNTLENDRSSWRSHWMELSDYLLPRRGSFLMESQSSKGRKRNSKIIDSTGTKALRTMAAGMMSGMTSPARPWFRYSTRDKKLMLQGDVRLWINDVEEIVREILQRSNFYNSMHTIYEELGAFGTAPLYRQPSFSSVVRYRPFTAGEYVIAENDEGIVDTVGRRFQMTVGQIYQKFVMDADTKREDWTGVSRATKALWNNKQFDSLVDIVHMIEPRELAARKPGKPGKLNMPFRSLYFEHGGDGDEVLYEGGYKKMPVYVPRWDVSSGEIYGRSPGMDTLGDIKQLQHQQKRKAQAIDKMVTPPMVASVSLRGKPASQLPGATTYVDPMQGSQGYQPAYKVEPRVQEMMLDIEQTQKRIDAGLYADLFAMMINSDRRNITATEVVERHEEKLVLLGPALQRINVELLDPCLDDAFEFALEAGLLPTPPRALHGQELSVRYVSLLAQAQQAVSAASIERVMGFSGNLVAVFPEITDVIDADEAVRDYADTLGTPAKLVRDRKTVQKMRDGRRQQQESQTQMAMAAQGAQAAKVLSETDTQNPNALTDLMGRGATVRS